MTSPQFTASWAETDDLPNALEVWSDITDPATTGRGTGWAWNGSKFWDSEGGWDAMVAATGQAEWVRAVTTGGWFPATVVEAAKTLDRRMVNGKRVRFSAPGRPCEEDVVGAWDAHRCERPVVGTWDTPRGQVHLCSIHLRTHQRHADQTRELQERFANQREADARRQEHKRLGQEVMDWAGPVLAELGIHPATVTVGSIGERTGVLLPAEAVATLVQEATGERYPGRDNRG